MSAIFGTSSSDTISNYQSNVTIYSGGGNDTVFNFNAYNSHIDLGDGDDSIQNYAAHEYGTLIVINGGSGNDKIYQYDRDSFSTVDDGDGNDKLSLDSDASGNTISGGAGNDTISLNGTANMIQYAQGDGNDAIYGFSNYATLNITSGSYTTLINGNDFIVSVGSGRITLKDASANYNPLTRIKILDAEGNVAIYNDWSVYSGTSGSESLNNYMPSVTIDAAAGNDIINNHAYYALISGGNGNDSIYSPNYHVTLDGGTGNDTIMTNYVSPNDCNTSINGGAGNDVITLKSDSARNYSGSYYAYIGNNTIKGGTDNDTIYANVSLSKKRRRL